MHTAKSEFLDSGLLSCREYLAFTVMMMRRHDTKLRHQVCVNAMSDDMLHDIHINFSQHCGGDVSHNKIIQLSPLLMCDREFGFTEKRGWCGTREDSRGRW